MMENTKVYAIIYAVLAVVCLVRGVLAVTSGQSGAGTFRLVLAAVFIVAAIVYLRRK